MKICHIISMSDITQMGSITQEIYKRCDGDHIWDSVFNKKPKKADVYIIHCFKNHTEDFVNWKIPKGYKAISLMHSSYPCMPTNSSNEVVTITRAQQNTLFLDHKIGSHYIRGAIDLTEYLKVKPDYSEPIITRIARMQKGKTHNNYNRYIMNLLNSNAKKAIFITDKYKDSDYIKHDNCEYIEGIEIKDNKKKAEILSGCSIYADAHSCNYSDLFVETFCVALLEGMASGLAPIILGQYQPAMREVVGGSGIIAEDEIDFQRHLMHLCESQSTREAFGAYARERAKEFNLDRMIKEWNELIKSLL
jgi:glycosyltransferase involved in cell wall biosynthesis